MLDTSRFVIRDGKRCREFGAGELSAVAETEIIFGRPWRTCPLAMRREFLAYFKWLTGQRALANTERERRRLAREERWADIRDGVRAPMSVQSAEYGSLYHDRRGLAQVTRNQEARRNVDNKAALVAA